MAFKDHDFQRVVLKKHFIEEKDRHRGLYEITTAFQKHDVKAVLVGGLAVRAYGSKRDTLDADFFVGPGTTTQLKAAMSELGLNLSAVPDDYFDRPNVMLEISYSGSSVDALSHIPGLEFEETFAKSLEIELPQQKSIRVASLESLIASKTTKARPKDLLDAEFLESLL